MHCFICRLIEVDILMTLGPDDLLAALRRCEDEPIHQIGLIQPHGLLLALGPAPEYRIAQVSANVEEFFDQPPEYFLGTPLTTLLGAEQVHELFEVPCPGEDYSPSGQLVYAIVGEQAWQFHALPQPLGALWLLELEPIDAPYEARRILPMQQRIQQAILAMQGREELGETLDMLARSIHHFTGYDRVMVYRFERDWEGEVMAESRDPDRLPSYLGHRFPAGDIPPQARALYLRNPFRLFIDTEAEPSPLVPAINPHTGAPLDMSSAVLRSFSPVHVEYLRNMGVRASMSFALIVEGRLWGLVACHHTSPRQLDHPTRELVKFLGNVAAMKLASLVATERDRMSRRVNDTIGLLLDLLYRGGPPSQRQLRFEQHLSDLIDASGILVRMDGRRFRRGALPSDAELDRLLPWLDRQVGEEILAIDHLTPLFPEAAAYADLAAGVLGVWLDRERGDSICWFRSERIRQVNWAGNPEKMVVQDREGGLKISPRLSFATWSETWRGRCTPWLQPEIELAGRMARLLHQAFRLLLTSSVRQSVEPTATQVPGFQSAVANEALLRNLPAGVVVHASDTQIVYANPRALELLRLSEEQALGRQALRPEWNLIDEHGHTLSVAEYPVNRVLASGETITGMLLGIVDQWRPEPTWVLVHAYPQQDAAGERLAIVTFVDVSDRQRIPFRQIVDMANDAVVVTDAEPLTSPGPRIVYVNQAFTRLTGYSEAEVLGRSPRMFQSSDTDRAALDRMRDCLEQRRPTRETVLNRGKSGAVYWLDIDITPLFDHQDRVKYFVAIERDVTSKALESMHLKDAAESDPLTGLLNRRGFAARIRALPLAHRKEGPLCSAITADLDHFKRINDSFGHDAGDEVLRGLGGLMRQVFRRDDICARFGGEEFVVVLPATDLDEAAIIAERLRALVAQRLRAPDQTAVTVSIGVTVWMEDDDFDRLLRRADQALYQAKTAGRNRVHRDAGLPSAA